MDVTLVLTHRCNLACHYCYAGEHFRKEMDRETMERGLDLLFADRAEAAQLAFFGGEPFLAHETMRRAIEGARARAARRGAVLTLQCTTNATLVRGDEARTCAATGMRVTVSIDGVRAAHDLNRPLAGGGSSWEAVVAGLRALRDAGAAVDAMMVITPATAPYLALSVSWLWDEGIRYVRANLDHRGRWSLAERDLLRGQLLTVGRAMVARRRREDVTFAPLAEIRGACAPRRQIAVGADGRLYPCSPMVGEGRNEDTQMGHLDDGVSAILKRVEQDGACCGGGRICPCACYLETGDRSQPGPNYLWFGETSAEVRSLIAPPPVRLRREVEPPRRSRRGFVLGAGGLVLAAGAAAAAAEFHASEPELLKVESVAPAWEELLDAARSQGRVDGEFQPYAPEPRPPVPARVEVPTGGDITAYEPDPSRR